MKNGYLTVYLSLSLSLILSLVLTLVEGARMNTIRMETECVTDIGMNSVLAEFHRELLEQYDLLFVDMSYGTALPAIENSAEHLRNYMQMNFTRSKSGLTVTRDWLSLSVDKAAIDKYSIASDDNGAVMEGQALRYMEESTVEGMLAEITGQIAEMESMGLNTRNIAGERDNIQAQIDAIELPKKEKENGELEEIPLNNPADKVNASRSMGVLNLILRDASSISNAAIYEGNYISHREKSGGTGMNPGFRRPEGTADKLLFDEYLFEKCGRYGSELEKSLLKYQIEYILTGQNSDRDNLEGVAKQLLSWREAGNVIYILSDSVKCAEAEALALTLTAVLQVPALTQPVKYAILFAWAYIESLYDVRCLLNGGKVPIIKTSADWKTSIKNVSDFNGNIPEDNSSGRGLSYKDYLRIMLYLQDETVKNMRVMDIMEMDIRRTPGNRYFRMDACFDSFLADISVSSEFGYHYNIQRRYGYD